MVSAQVNRWLSGSSALISGGRRPRYPIAQVEVPAMTGMAGSRLYA